MANPITSDSEILARRDSRRLRVALIGSAVALALGAALHLWEANSGDLRGRAWLGFIPHAGLLYGGSIGVAFAILSERLASPTDAIRIALAGLLAAGLSLASLVAIYLGGSFIDGTPIPPAMGLAEFLARLADSAQFRGSTVVVPAQSPRFGGAWSFAIDAAVAALIAILLAAAPLGSGDGATDARRSPG